MIYIFIMDAEAADRAGLHQWLIAEDDFTVVGSVGSYQTAQDELKNIHVDIFLVGDMLDDMPGTDAIKKLMWDYNDVACLLLARQDTPELRKAALYVGVRQLLVKPPDRHALLAAIRSIYPTLLDLRADLRGGGMNPDDDVQPRQHQSAKPPAPITQPAINEEIPPTSGIDRPGPGMTSPVAPAESSAGYPADGDDDDENLFGVEIDELEEAQPPKPVTRDTGEAAATETSAAPLDKAVRFSAYYPPRAQPTQHYGLYVYAHVANAISAIQQDVQKFAAELGGSVPQPRTAPRPAEVATGTLLTVVPECDGVEFEPAALTKKWRGDWTRFDFDFAPPATAAVGDILLIRVSVQVSGIEIARINCPVDISDTSAEQPAIPLPPPGSDILTIPENPLAAARLKASSAVMYSKIFISYSRRDKEVVKAYRLAQIAAGHEVFMDTENIHTGENWQAALAKAIDEADIFQLFWSEASASSPNVRDEWDYCLRYKCTDNNCAGFIRPVYWQKPLPAPPAELSHLNFRYVPLTDDEDE